MNLRGGDGSRTISKCEAAIVRELLESKATRQFSIMIERRPVRAQSNNPDKLP